jgi:hypothetical protein
MLCFTNVGRTGTRVGAVVGGPIEGGVTIPTRVCSYMVVEGGSLGSQGFAFLVHRDVAALSDWNVDSVTPVTPQQVVVGAAVPRSGAYAHWLPQAPRLPPTG